MADVDIQNVGSCCLVVILHGFGRSNKALSGVSTTILEAIPDADIFLPDLAIRNRFTTRPVEVMASAVIAGIDARVSRCRYQSIVLVGHSFGGLIARKVFLAAWGHADDIVDIGGLPIGPRDWARNINRIVFFAAVNRGWTISSALSYLQSFWWRLGTLVNDVALRGKMAVFQSRRGAPFLIETRLQWLRLMADETLPARKVTVVKLLGTVADFVSPDDVVDEVADFSQTNVATSASRRFWLWCKWCTSVG